MKYLLNKIILTSALLILVACSEQESKSEENGVINQDQEKPDSEQLITVTRAQFEHEKMELAGIAMKPFFTTVQTTGIIDVPPKNRAVVSATMGGYVKNTTLLVGDKVKEGQALLTLENPEFVSMQQNYLEVRQQLNYLKSEFERQKTLLEENITSKKRFLKAESDYKTALATYHGLRKQLTLLKISPSKVESGKLTTVVTIFAPIAGSITKINIVKGMYVSPATEMLEIIDNDHIHVELSVFEKDIMKVKVGQKILFKLPEVSDKIYEAVIYLIGTSIDEQRKIQIHGHLDDNEKSNFLTGMFVDATIILDSTEGMALPETAFIEKDDGFYILKLINETEKEYSFQKIKVKPTGAFNKYVKIEAPSIKSSDTFLIKGAFHLIVNDL
ncbi:MAG: efflux RND transporter periplasmic adaptor subunit [Flavobacteriaceae bacterium]|nr:efflux RND transporter periplasmic adaptor subunit [Flavobacteriaceae bacterium]